MMRRFLGEPLRFYVAGYGVEISLYFCAAAALLLLLDPQGMIRWCMAAALLHELGHIAAIALLEGKACEIRLTAFGIRLFRPVGVGQYWKDILISLSGPVTNILAFSALILLGRAGASTNVWQIPAYTQLAIGAFNLLPVYPLDGGQAVNAALCCFFSASTADILSNCITFLFLAPLGALGFYVLFQSKYNYSLLALTAYLTILFVLKEKH